MAERTSGDFGGKLRAARERRGISLRQIANATKISIAALEALERNDISRLPGGIFSRAFVRSYAIEVGLDPESTIQDFITQFPNDSVIAGHPTSDQEDHEAVESERRSAGTFLWLAVISVPIAGVLLYLATAGRQATRPSAAPTDRRATSRAVESPPPAADSVPAATPAGGAATDSAPAAAATSAPPPGATPTTPPAATTPTSSTPSSTPATQPAGDAAVDHLAVQLSTSRPCWVSATVDGKREIERLLQPGEKTTVDVKREMVLTAGDAAALALTLNGAEARPLGKAGEVVTARVNLTNYKTFLQAR
jgi:cytoskeletal protein RodZ